MHARVSTRTFGLMVTLAGFFVFVAAAPAHHPPLNVFQPRQGSASATNNSPTAAPATSANPTTAQTSPTSAAASSTSQPAQATSTPTSQQQTSAQQQTSQPAASGVTTSANAASSAAPTSTFTSALVTTDKGGQVFTSVVVISDSPSSTTSSKPSSSTSSSAPSGGSGISSSTIIGLSVAGGAALICLIGFFVWKFSRKRIGGYDSNEEIKWPELNAHDTAVPLPTNRTGGAGFDTGADGGRASLGYAPSTAANSMADLNDPYAVPPLPPNDQNQTFRDDPNPPLYDPYYGPIPNTFNQTGPGESIPMTQFSGRRSPGPGLAYGPSVGGGRVSPGPQVAYGGDAGGRASPGPRAPYSGGRVSPSPQAAYGGNAYAPR